MKRFVFEKINLVILVLALVLIMVGYILLGKGDRTVSPVLMVISYVVLIPGAFLIQPKDKS